MFIWSYLKSNWYTHVPPCHHISWIYNSCLKGLFNNIVRHLFSTELFVRYDKKQNFKNSISKTLLVCLSAKQNIQHNTLHLKMVWHGRLLNNLVACHYIMFSYCGSVVITGADREQGDPTFEISSYIFVLKYYVLKLFVHLWIA